MGFESDFDQSRLMATLDLQHWQRLDCSLIQPPCRNLRRARDAYLKPRRVRKIHVMRLHAVREAPFRLAACAFGKMAEFGFDDAEVALRKRDKTTIAESLAKTFLGWLAAAITGNLPSKFETQRFSQQRRREALPESNR